MRIDRINNYTGFEDDKTQRKSEAGSFGQYLKSALDSANEAMVKADEETLKLITGESEDLHQALIAAEEARIQMELVMQVRNKLLESYQEISRMQI